ncbi:DUF397 domain-containing protein [Micromonospora purpureochromogenes]|uniref:DUF397 domain-containing protein n=1 Tax=Micromonospora purpureochromogenes TaxID=47872 RepID=A0ABX2RIS3_9ACTN|nr:DUF397 domain-containing protein [Micromonospora purpureochromogenes]NYF55091.1 hypothetical protein [Micromonospora purpureochromogenes]
MNDIRNTVSARQLAHAPWRKSTRSQTSNCVEVAPLGAGPAVVALRDSKDPSGPVLLFNRAGWLGFVGAAKDGQFDLN